MLNFSIGLSGLNVAQRAIELIGTNLANASTAGYHAERLNISPVELTNMGITTAGGAEVSSVQRLVDKMVEQELLRQRGSLGQTNQMTSTLQTVEGALGSVDSNNLATSLNDFLQSLRELSSNPQNVAMQQQVLWSADSMCGQFRNVSDFLTTLQGHIAQSAGQVVQKINDLSSQIADLNGQIMNVTNVGGSANLLQDQRDQAISDLSELTAVQVDTHNSLTGVVNVEAWGMPLVSGTHAMPLALLTGDSGRIGISIEGADYPHENVTGGTLGALVTLRNQTLPALQQQVDDLAGQVIGQINALHAQGVGTAGSFDELDGVRHIPPQLSDWNAGIVDGEINVRVIDKATGQAVRTKVAIHPGDSLTAVAQRLDAIAGLSASVIDGHLHMQADTGKQFDFLPTLAAQPLSTTITGTGRATISGAYSGDVNQVYSVRAAASGQIGVTQNLSLEVRDGAGQLVKTVNVGLGYGPGDTIELPDGIKVALTAGTLNTGDAFTIEALHSTDTSGFLAAAGMNTLLAGSSAADMSVRSEVMQDPSRLAISSSSSVLNNDVTVQMGDLTVKPLDALGSLSATDFLRKFISDVGEHVASEQARQSTYEGLVQQLSQQRDEVSKVDVNEQSAELMMFQRMYQSLAKFLSASDESSKSLMEIL